ncbi:VOC family protein [Agrococcus sp. SL85]|uniref:VOC family protein n=1 Tax=Agrococcus sp. SL85 TaxID=2995141 RepID=UPI00226D2FF4|nr:VOC family protein [Agrococcus sp. SL85]WAC66015.1 VOC family protein [Agrococcus sp. SL85]
MSVEVPLRSTVVSGLDHVVLAGPDLAAAIDHVEALTGVRAAPGGRHPRGTANALIAFTRGGRRVRQYLEVIGPDAEAGWTADRVDTFGIDRLEGPRVVTFSARPTDIEAAVAAARAAGVPFQDVEPLSRRTPDGRELAWRLARPEDGETHPPFLIDWGATPHPGLERLPTLELVSLRRLVPDVEAESARLRALGVAVGTGDEAVEVVAAEEAGFELDVRVGDCRIRLR